MNIRVLGMACLVLCVMTLSTMYIGPGIGVEANCVSLQTCGKTMIVVLKDAAQAGCHLVRGGLPAVALPGMRLG